MRDDPLGQVNRFVIVVAALVVIFLALLLALLAWGAASGSIAQLEDLSAWLRRHDDREAKLIITLAAAVVTFGMLATIIVELTPSPTQKMRVRSVRSGSAAISTDQIAERINAEVRYIRNIAGCNAVVAARGRRIEVVLNLDLDPGANLAEAADEACGRTQALVEQQLGIELAQPPRARLRYRELRLRERDERAGNGAPAAVIRGEPGTGWEPPVSDAEGERDQRRQPDAPEEAQA
ncbi:MAG: hypothetical protein M3P30_13760 [Chloroflexota bacterium]|nr:hypothetical protein [Chloroflexota bacterium]